MTKGIASGGVDFDALFDPDVMGDGPTAAGWSSGGVLLKYAALSYGTKRADVGYAVNGVDVSNLWAAAGTAVYALPMNGQSFMAIGSYGDHWIEVDMKSDGTYQVLRHAGVNLGATTTVASGTWLPAGESAANWSVQFVPTITDNTSDGAGSTSTTNGAPAASALTTTRIYVIDATVPGSPTHLPEPTDDANIQASLAIKLFKSGVLKSTTNITVGAQSGGG